MNQNLIPAPVTDAIIKRFDPPMAADILSRLTFSPLMGCYTFTHAGMFWGVEPDGYIHT